MSRKLKETIKLLQDDSLIIANETHSLMTHLLLSEQRKSMELSRENDMLKAVITSKRKKK